MRIKDLKISTKLYLLIALAALGYFVFGFIGYRTIEEIKVNGPIYNRISVGKSLDADVVPPTLYLNEARMNLYQLMYEQDPAKFQVLIERIREYEKKFQQSHEDYMKTLPNGALKDQVNGTVYTEGAEWIRLVETEFIPAKLKGDEKTISQVFVPHARPPFQAHREAALALAKAVEDDNVKLEEEASQTVRSRSRVLLFAGLGLVAVIIFFGLFTSKLVTNSLQQTVSVLQTVSTGDLRPRLDVQTKDESGLMGDALNHTLDQISGTMRRINESAIQLAAASEEFSATSQQITANSEETSAQARVVSAATEQVNHNLQTVATSTEEMAASVKDIAQNAGEAARVAGEAMKTVQVTNATVSKLGQSSAEIGQVIKVITSIAQKTDLLALNATVEAARAGEVGAGFAVVANEVKELAKQTSNATEEISRKIEAIQSDAKAAVQAISSISSVITRVNEISMSIATAVEEQSATTNEMARNVSEAARGSGEVAHNIGGVAQAAQDTSSSAGQSLTAANQLAKLSQALREMVEQFKLDSGKSAKRKPGKSGNSSPNSFTHETSQTDPTVAEEALVR